MGLRGALRTSLVCWALLAARPTAAQLEEGIKSWADATSGITTAVWAGDRVPFPTPTPRPRGGYWVESTWRPLAVHAPDRVPLRRAQRVLDALELAYDVLSEAGWAGGDRDGGAGGSAGRDLYLVEGLAKRASAALDATEPVGSLDAAQSYALLDAWVASDRLLSCVTSAYVQSRLLDLDPAEAESWRRATGAYLGWLVSGELGCSDDAARLQREPWRTVIGRDSGEDGGLWLALLAQQRDGGRGSWLWDVWQLSRQRTWQGDGLRASPDMWESLAAALEAEGTPLEDVAAELAVERFYAPLGLDPPPRWHELRYAELPARTRPTRPPLQTLGSAYALVDTAGCAQGDQLRVWMRGEDGVRWGLVAVRLDAEGRERGRVSAPPRRETRSYLVVDLDAETARVLVVVTNLSHRLPDADLPDDNERAAYLIFDR